MGLLIEIAVSALVLVGSGFVLVGSIALAKLPDAMQRLHGPTKATTLGVGGILLASMAYFFFILDRLSFHELLISIFLLLTAPISAHLLAKAYLHIRSEGRR
jgi:multicomponent K+:H+ antiporter subunit G